MRTALDAAFVLLILAPATALMAHPVRVRPQHQRARRATSSTAMAALAARNSGVESWRWNDGHGRELPSWDAVVDTIVNLFENRDDIEVHVGCDSAHNPGGRVVFATVVCVIAKGKFGRYFYSRSIEEKTMYPVLQTRLLREVELSITTAEALTEHDVLVNAVHCDSNTDPQCKSTEHTRMLIGYIRSMGYDHLVKPDAWATFVADRHSRGLARRLKNVDIEQLNAYAA